MRNNSLAPALIGSALLHVAVFGFALWKFPNETREILNAVPVQIVSDMPALAPAPSVEPEMNETPEPVVEETPVPEPTPPTPEPPKPTPPKPEPKPEPKPAKPDKAPVKKPTKEAATDPLDFVKDLSRSSSKPKSSQAATPAKGTSRTGTATQDMGPAINALSAKLMRLWLPNCGVEGAEEIVIKVRFTLNETGRISKAPEVVNGRTDAVWEAAASRAKYAVIKGEPYDDLPPELFNQQITVNFKGSEACR